MMEALLNWLHSERKVIRKAPWFAAGIALASAMAAFLLAASFFKLQVSEAQQSAVTAQMQRDLWKDRYEEAVKVGKPTSSAPKPTVAFTTVHEPEIDIPRTAGLVGLILAVSLVALLLTPLPHRQRHPPEETLERPHNPVPESEGQLSMVPRPEPTPAPSFIKPPQPKPSPELARKLAEAMVGARQTGRAQAVQQWARVGSFELWEAAALWSDELPPKVHLLPLSDSGAANLAMLKAAIVAGDLLPLPPQGPAALRIALGGEADDRTRVKRDALVAYAEKIGERPAFLFT